MAVSRARACGVIEEKSKAAKVACEGMFLRIRELGLLLRIDCAIRKRLARIKGKDVRVLGFEEESKTLDPKKVEDEEEEERKVFVSEEAMDFVGRVISEYTCLYLF